MDTRYDPRASGPFAAWREALIEAAPCNSAAPARTRHGGDLAEQVRAVADDWTAQLL